MIVYHEVEGKEGVFNTEIDISVDEKKYAKDYKSNLWSHYNGYGEVREFKTRFGKIYKQVKGRVLLKSKAPLITFEEVDKFITQSKFSLNDMQKEANENVLNKSREEAKNFKGEWTKELHSKENKSLVFDRGMLSYTLDGKTKQSTSFFHEALPLSDFHRERLSPGLNPNDYVSVGSLQMPLEIWKKVETTGKELFEVFYHECLESPIKLVCSDNLSDVYIDLKGIRSHTLDEVFKSWVKRNGYKIGFYGKMNFDTTRSYDIGKTFFKAVNEKSYWILRRKDVEKIKGTIHDSYFSQKDEELIATFEIKYEDFLEILRPLFEEDKRTQEKEKEKREREEKERELHQKKIMENIKGYSLGDIIHRGSGETKETYQSVSITHSSNEVFYFTVRNIFDFGRVINPKGGGFISEKDMLCQKLDNETRKVSQEELEAYKAAQYLSTIDSNVNM